MNLDLTNMLGPSEARIGIDVGGTKTQAVAFGPSGEIGVAHRPTDTAGIAGITATVSSLVDELRLLPEADSHTISAIGIGIPGIVDTAAGTVSHGVNIGLAESDVPLAATISRATGVPVSLANDVTAATIGAARYLGSSDDVALISLGTGLASGLILDGIPRTGKLGSAGEIGHIPYIPDGLPCPCGQRGCLELYASGHALTRAWPQGGKHPATHLMAAARTGDADARSVLDSWIHAVAHAVTLLGLTLDVQEILIAGGITEVGAPLLEELRGQLRRSAEHSQFLRQMGLDSRVRLVPRGAHVAALGACLTTF
ncbi:MAG: ROK family protein [Ancrocorticia sp.]|uniref:ROK family protein n=1 Tax=Ancrocorticia sp. TaxID=2593684 RepID=UPI003F901FCF